jgi:hypothetical protein
LTIVTSSEDEFGEGPEITLEDATKNKHLPNDLDEYESDDRRP